MLLSLVDQRGQQLMAYDNPASIILEKLQRVPTFLKLNHFSNSKILLLGRMVEVVRGVTFQLQLQPGGRNKDGEFSLFELTPKNDSSLINLLFAFMLWNLNTARNSFSLTRFANPEITSYFWATIRT